MRARPVHRREGLRHSHFTPIGRVATFPSCPPSSSTAITTYTYAVKTAASWGGSFCGCSVFNLNGVSFYVLCREKLLHEFYGQVTPLSHRYHSWVSVLSSSPSSSSMADKIHIFCKLALANCRMVLSLISRNFSDLIPPFSFLREFSKFPDTYLLRSRPFRNFTREAALYLSPSRNIFFLKFGLKILQIGENLVLEKWHFLVGRLIWT